MIEDIFKEREDFLRHQQRQGTSRKALVSKAGVLLHIIRLLRMGELQDVGLDEIREAASNWAIEQRSNPRAKTYAASASNFRWRNSGCATTDG
jgi:hypothetical protein